jgi:hypothetical protein
MQLNPRLMDVYHDGAGPLEAVLLSGGEARDVSGFKYLGVDVDPSACWEAEIKACIMLSKAKEKFAELHCVWQMRKLKVELRMKCFHAHVLPVLLFDSGTWALTENQAKRLEVVPQSEAWIA